MDPRRITFVPKRFIVSRYLTKIFDQLVCLLSPEHLQAIVWTDEDDNLDDASLDLGNIDSCRLVDFSIHKQSEQKDNVNPANGKWYVISGSQFPSVVTSINCLWSDELLTSRRSTLDVQSAYRPKCLISEAALWGNNAGCHDREFKLTMRHTRRFLTTVRAQLRFFFFVSISQLPSSELPVQRYTPVIVMPCSFSLRHSTRRL